MLDKHSETILHLLSFNAKIYNITSKWHLMELDDDDATIKDE